MLNSLKLGKMIRISRSTEAGEYECEYECMYQPEANLVEETLDFEAPTSEKIIAAQRDREIAVKNRQYRLRPSVVSAPSWEVLVVLSKERQEEISEFAKLAESVNYGRPARAQRNRRRRKRLRWRGKL